MAIVAEGLTKRLNYDEVIKYVLADPEETKLPDRSAIQYRNSFEYQKILGTTFEDLEAYNMKVHKEQERDSLLRQIASNQEVSHGLLRGLIPRSTEAANQLTETHQAMSAHEQRTQVEEVSREAQELQQEQARETQLQQAKELLQVSLSTRGGASDDEMPVGASMTTTLTDLNAALKDVGATPIDTPQGLTPREPAIVSHHGPGFLPTKGAKAEADNPEGFQPPKRGRKSAADKAAIAARASPEATGSASSMDPPSAIPKRRSKSEAPSR